MTMGRSPATPAQPCRLCLLGTSSSAADSEGARSCRIEDVQRHAPRCNCSYVLALRGRPANSRLRAHSVRIGPLNENRHRTGLAGCPVARTGGRQTTRSRRVSRPRPSDVAKRRITAGMSSGKSGTKASGAVVLSRPRAELVNGGPWYDHRPNRPHGGDVHECVVSPAWGGVQMARSVRDHPERGDVWRAEDGRPRG